MLYPEDDYEADTHDARRHEEAKQTASAAARQGRATGGSVQQREEGNEVGLMGQHGVKAVFARAPPRPTIVKSEDVRPVVLSKIGREEEEEEEEEEEDRGNG